MSSKKSADWWREYRRRCAARDFGFDATYPFLLDPVPLVRDAMTVQSQAALQLRDEVIQEWRGHAPHNPRAGG